MENRQLQDGSIWGNLKNRLFSEIEEDGDRIRRCLQFVFILGLAAHAYGFLNFTINHDSLAEFYGWPLHKVSLGRFMATPWRQMMGDVMVSVWLNGLLSLLFIGLTVYIISKMFSLNKVWENLALAGVCVTNVTVTCFVASYVHDLSGNMLALLMAAAAAYLWSKMENGINWKDLVMGAVLLAMSQGFYQAFAAVMISLVCIYTVLLLLRGEEIRTVLIRIAIAVAMFALSAVLYFGLANLALRYYNTQFAETDGKTIAAIGENVKELLFYGFVGYRSVLRELFRPNMDTVQGVFEWQAKVVCLFNGVLFMNMLWILYAWAKKKAKSVVRVILVLFALAMLPLCMSSVAIISTVFKHLVRYAYYLYYLLAIVMFRYAWEEKLVKRTEWQSLLAVAAIGAVIVCNIQVSNIAYTKKELERQNAMFTMTRVVTRLEEMEEYIPGETPVAIFGGFDPDKEKLYAGSVEELAGLGYSAQITYTATIENYIDTVLQYDINLVSGEEQNRIKATEAYHRMGCFPAKDSIAIIDGTVVVRMDKTD